MVHDWVTWVARRCGTWPLLLAVLPGICACPAAGDSDDDDSSEPPAALSDQDGDTILDAHEGSADVDGDGLPNYLDADSDGDTIPDALEAGDADPLTFPRDSDGDGESDFVDADSDDNGIPDMVEVGPNPLEPLDFDGDTIPDYADMDNDGDRIADTIEIAGAIPVDTDGDAYPDYYDSDSDGDTILDADEAGDIAVGDPPRDFDGDGWADYRDQDADGDGAPDSLEAGDEDPGTPPRDTDNDGDPDFVDLDSDGDSLADELEFDGWTDAYARDTDGDGVPDGVESVAGSDPVDADSLPETVWLEVRQRAVTVRTFVFQVAIGSADIVFILDDTGSMTEEIKRLSMDFSQVVEDVRSSVPDAAFGVATFQDYHGKGFGGNVQPFELVQQVTTDQEAVENALMGLSGSGGSGKTSAIEALHQALAGTGFDQDCDMDFDSGEDVRPFIASPSDVFQGSVSGSRVDDPSSPGMGGGCGFRAHSLPILVYGTDVVPRDADLDDPLNPVPDACAPPATSAPAGTSLVLAEAVAMGARLIGVNVNGVADLQQVMVSMATATGSMVDLDHDGIDDPLVFDLGSVSTISAAIVEGVSSLASAGSFSRADLESESDPYGFMAGAYPEEYQNVQAGDTLTFDVTFLGAVPAQADDQIFVITLVVVGDQSTGLDQQDVIIVVPGEG